MGVLAEALSSQCQALCDYASRLRQLRDIVNSPGNLSVSQWAHLYAMVREFKPDLIIELGRGAGNSTTVFTDCANMLGNSKVLSVGFDFEQMWKQTTAPRLESVVGKEWHNALEAIHADIMDIDFKPYVIPANRILLFWDAHGYELAFYILGQILPLLEPKEHLIVVHDIDDANYGSPRRNYVQEDGLPLYYAGNLCSPFEELYPLFDFLSRNRIHVETADHDVFHILRTDRQNWNRIADLYSKSYGLDTPLAHGGMAYFSLSERKDKRSPVAYPPVNFSNVREAHGKIKKADSHSMRYEELSFSHILYDEAHTRLMRSLQRNCYGKPELREVLSSYGGGILFIPSSARDHLSTQYTSLVPENQGGGNCLKVTFSFAEERRPGMNCIIYLQDRDFNQISYNMMFHSKKGHLKKERIEYVEVDSNVSAFRMVITTKDGAPTYIPELIRIEQSNR